MSDATLTQGPSPEPGGHGLGTSLKPRHITMISIAGVIGAGLFVGSATAISKAGPAVLDLLRPGRDARRPRHADARRDGDGQPRHRVVLHLLRARVRPVGGLLGGLAVLVVLGARHPGRGDRRRRRAAPPRRAGPVGVGARGDVAADGDEPRQRRQLRRVRVLVRPHQGRRDRPVHRRRGARHPRCVPGKQGQRRLRAVAAGRLPAQRCRGDRRRDAHDDVLLHGHRDRHHRRRRVARPGEGDRARPSTR